MHTVTHFFLHANPLLIYLIVVVMLMLESTGIPIVNNTLLLFTGALASLGYLNIGELAIAAIAGSVSGACLAYWIGAHGGQQGLLRLVVFLHIDSQKVYIVEHWFQKFGVWMVFFSRMIPYVRPFACFPAGMSQTNFTRFFLGATAGSTIWCIAMLSLGWNLGRRWDLALHVMQQYTIPMLCVLLLVIVIYVLVMRIAKQYMRSHLPSASIIASGETVKQHHELLESSPKGIETQELRL